MIYASRCQASATPLHLWKIDPSEVLENVWTLPSTSQKTEEVEEGFYEMVKTRVEVTKNTNGRPESFKLYEGSRLVLHLVYDWDDSGLLMRINFIKGNLALAEKFNLLDRKFIERISLIDLIETIRTIETIDEITTITNISNIETISSLPDITVLGSEGASIKQSAPVAGSYFSPTGEEASTWIDPDDAFDGFTATYATEVLDASGASNTDFLVLTFAAAVCNKVRVWVSGNAENNYLDIDVYQGSSWVHVWQGVMGTGDMNAWFEKSFAQGSTTKVRCRFFGFPTINERIFNIYEVEMFQSATGSELMVTEDNSADIETAVQSITSTAAVTIYNVTMTNADTEYSQALGTAKKFLIHTRDETIFRLAFVTGKVATPTAPYFTILANEAYYEDNIKQSLTLYFASPNAGKIIEIIAWT